MTITFFDANARTPGKHLSTKRLAYLTAGTWQPTTGELEQLVDHIVACKDCRKNLETFIIASIDADQPENCPGAILPGFFAKIRHIIREIDMQNDISAYIETLEMQDLEEAEHQFPLLAEHLKKCKACQSLLEETLTLLHRAEGAGLIAPLSRIK